MSRYYSQGPNCSTSGPPAHQSTQYYQIGGFGCSRNRPGARSWQTADDLSKEVFRFNSAQEQGLDLIFGAGYLLIPRSQSNPRPLERLFDSRSGKVYTAEGFVSLSPVHFSTQEQLEQTLDNLAQRSKKSKNSGERKDTSKANRGFVQGDEENVVSTNGISRASFEYQRLFVRSIRQEISKEFFALSPPSWLKDIRVISFAFNLWAIETRSKEQRGDDLRILDVGWTEFHLADFSATTTTHLKLKETARLKNPHPTGFAYGKTEVLPRSEVQSRLQESFGSENTSKPIVLLVHDSENALHVLRVLGIPSVSWHHGIEPVLGLKILQRDVRLPKREADPFRISRDRSLSPSGNRDHRERSPVEMTGKVFPVYVVDVGDLYRLAMEQPAAQRDIRTMAAQLEVETDKKKSQQILSGWCAGNESRLLGFVWHKMATGNALEEQRKTLHTTGVPKDSKPSIEPGEQSEDEIDPNDIRPQAVQQQKYAADPYDDMSDDDDW